MHTLNDMLSQKISMCIPVYAHTQNGPKIVPLGINCPVVSAFSKITSRDCQYICPEIEVKEFLERLKGSTLVHRWCKLLNIRVA